MTCGSYLLPGSSLIRSDRYGAALFTPFLSHVSLCCCYFVAALWCPVMCTTFHLFLFTPCSNEREFFSSVSPRPKPSDQGSKVDNFTRVLLRQSRKSCRSAEQNVTLVLGSVTTHCRSPSGQELPFVLP